MARRRVGTPANVAIDHQHQMGWFELVASLRRLRHRLEPDISDELLVERMGMVDPDYTGKTGLLELAWESGQFASAVRKLKKFERCEVIDLRMAQAYAHALGRQLTFRIEEQHWLPRKLGTPRKTLQSV